MSVPNFSFLACLEVAEKFVVGVGVGVDHVATVSSGLPKPKYFGQNQEPTRKKVSVSVPGLIILEITGYWLGTWF